MLREQDKENKYGIWYIYALVLVRDKGTVHEEKNIIKERKSKLFPGAEERFQSTVSNGPSALFMNEWMN